MTNVVVLLVLLTSGLQIFNAHQALYFGAKSNFDDGDAENCLAVYLDDRFADRQTHAYAAGFGRVEGIEQPGDTFGAQAWT